MTSQAIYYIVNCVTIETLPPISLKRFPRTLSAPATLQLHRQNSAKIYKSKMFVKPTKRAQSAITY